MRGAIVLLLALCGALALTFLPARPAWPACITHQQLVAQVRAADPHTIVLYYVGADARAFLSAAIALDVLAPAFNLVETTKAVGVYSASDPREPALVQLYGSDGCVYWGEDASPFSVARVIQFMGVGV